MSQLEKIQNYIKSKYDGREELTKLEASYEMSVDEGYVRLLLSNGKLKSLSVKDVAEKILGMP